MIALVTAAFSFTTTLKADAGKFSSDGGSTWTTFPVFLAPFSTPAVMDTPLVTGSLVNGDAWYPAFIGQFPSFAAQPCEPTTFLSYTAQDFSQGLVAWLIGVTPFLCSWVDPTPTEQWARNYYDMGFRAIVMHFFGDETWGVSYGENFAPDLDIGVYITGNEQQYIAYYGVAPTLNNSMSSSISVLVELQNYVHEVTQTLSDLKPLAATIGAFYILELLATVFFLIRFRKVATHYLISILVMEGIVTAGVRAFTVMSGFRATTRWFNARTMQLLLYLPSTLGLFSTLLTSFYFVRLVGVMSNIQAKIFALIAYATSLTLTIVPMVKSIEMAYTFVGLDFASAVGENAKFTEIQEKLWRETALFNISLNSVAVFLILVGEIFFAVKLVKAASLKGDVSLVKKIAGRLLIQSTMIIVQLVFQALYMDILNQTNFYTEVCLFPGSAEARGRIGPGTTIPTIECDGLLGKIVMGEVGTNVSGLLVSVAQVVSFLPSSSSSSSSS